jgi:hypothetical protein
MKSLPESSTNWSLRQKAQSGYEVFRDKERRRERLRAKLVAKQRQ